MAKLIEPEVAGLLRIVDAEYESQRVAAAASERFPSVAVFTHLSDSATRHISRLCGILHSHGEKPPLLAPVVAPDESNLIEALETALRLEDEKVAVYQGLMHLTRNHDLKAALLPLLQSVSHLHLAAINDQLGIERSRPTATS